MVVLIGIVVATAFFLIVAISGFLLCVNKAKADNWRKNAGHKSYEASRSEWIKEDNFFRPFRIIFGAIFDTVAAVLFWPIAVLMALFWPMMLLDDHRERKRHKPLPMDERPPTRLPTITVWPRSSNYLSPEEEDDLKELEKLDK